MNQVLALSKNIPKLRFPEFSGEWGMMNAKDLFGNRKNKGIEGLPLYSVTIDNGLVPRRSILSKRIERDAKTEDNIVAYPSDIVYNMMRMWQGAFGLAPQKCMVSPAYIVLEPKKDVDSRFYSLLLKDSKYIYKLESYSYGLTSDRLRLYYKDFGSIKLPQPILQEQNKITDFLTTVEEKISFLNKKVELLKKYKKGVMQKIFTHQINFKDENGNDYPDWEERKLGEILDYEQPTKYIVQNVEYKNAYKIPVLTAGKTFILGYTNETEGIFKYDLPVIIFDDFTTASQFVGFPFKVKSSAIKILKAKKGVKIKIAHEILKRIAFTAEDHKRYWIGEFQDFVVQIPSENEQQKISDFLTSIDDIIQFEEKKLMQVKKFKKSLLQQMFI